MLLASHSQRQALDRCGAGVVRAHLVKPVFEDDLLDCMRSIFDPESASQTMSMQDSVNLDQALAEANAPDRTPLEILLVEDTPVNQTLAVHLLTKAGHRVTVANNGVEAIELFEKQHFDLILMDLQMPVMDGMEATEKIRAREMRRSWVSGSNQRLSYIVAMTAHAMDGDRERCLAAGMDEYLSKPIRRDALNSVLRQAEAHRSAPPADFTEMLHNWDH
jgi:protein-histidine pros-kinase